MTTSVDHFLAELRAFAASLDRGEREAFEALLAPGIARANPDDDVVGFAADPLDLAVRDDLREGLVRAGLTARARPDRRR